MKKLFLPFLSLLIVSVSFAQLSGNKYIPGSGGPDDYATIEAAIAALNSSGVGAGGVTFNVAAGHTETFTTALAGFITASGTAANPIIFKKVGAGANPLIISGLGTVSSSISIGSHGDGIIIIRGGDNITFDGIDLQENPIAASSQKMEYGYYLKKASATNACKNVIIKNCNVTLDKATIYSFGIFVSNIVNTSAATPTSTGGRHENIKIFNNTVSNAYGGIFIQGYSHTSSPYDLLDQNIEIGVDGANTITDFGGGTNQNVYGIYAINQNNMKIANNSVTGGTGTTAGLYGIATSGGNNSNIDIYNNTITLQSSSTTNQLMALNNAIGSSGTSNTVNIYNNTIENCSFPAATTGTMYLLYNSAYALNVNIYSNTIRNNSRIGTGTTWLLYDFNANPGSVSQIYNNSIYNNTNTGNGALYCINSSLGSSTTTKYIHDNLIYSNSSRSTIYGIYQAQGATIEINNNKIYSLISTTTAAQSAYGIYCNSGTDVKIYNNFVSDIKAVNSTHATTSACGIYLNGGTNAYVYFNSVLLDYTSTNASNTSAALFVNNTAPSIVDLRNNIFINNVDVTNGTLAAAFRKGGTSLSNLSANTNYNLYYAGTPSAKNLIFYDGTNSDQTIDEYKTRLDPLEANTKSFMVNFNSATDLHLAGLSIGDPNLLGTPLASITTDIDGQPRLSPPQGPYIGADESETPLPVELSLFSTKTNYRDVQLNWETKTETNSSIFVLERYTQGTQSWLKVGVVNASGNSNSVKRYSFIDKQLQSGKYIYRLKIVDADGYYKYSDEVEADVALPSEFTLSQNYPNPFNPTTKIDYQLPFDSKIILELYGITGERIATIINTEQSAGYYSASINADALNLASGVYIYKINASSLTGQSFVQVNKMILTK